MIEIVIFTVPFNTNMHGEINFLPHFVLFLAYLTFVSPIELTSACMWLPPSKVLHCHLKWTLQLNSTFPISTAIW